MTVTMENTAVYGHWTEYPDSQFSQPNVFHNEMIVDAYQFINYWRRCSLSSVFWSQYTSLFVPPTVADGWLNRNAVESVLAYLLNELFENCAKFSRGPELKVCYQSWIGRDKMIFQLTNHVIPEQEAAFVSFIKELLEGDTDELYFQRLEENLENDTSGSGLGFLTLINDYGIQFGFKFEKISPDSVQVNVQAHLSLKEI